MSSPACFQEGYYTSHRNRPRTFHNGVGRHLAASYLGPNRVNKHSAAGNKAKYALLQMNGVFSPSLYTMLYRATE